MALVIPTRALMVAWDERFDEAHRLFSTVLDRIYDDGDRAFFSAACALALMADGQRERAAATLRVALQQSEVSTSYLYTQKQLAIARATCAAAEALCGRATSAARIMQHLNPQGDALVETLRDVVSAISRAAKNIALRDEILDRLQMLESIGYGGVGKLLGAAVNCCLQADTAADGPLTKAEIAVLHALSEGLGPKDIAMSTGRSVYTIQAHIQNIIKKLGCSGRNEALTMARKRGILA